MLKITLIEMESIWTILMFVVLVIMVILLIGHHFKMKTIAQDEEYKLENKMVGPDRNTNPVAKD